MLVFEFPEKNHSTWAWILQPRPQTSEKPTFGMWAVIVIGIAFPNNMLQCLRNMNSLGFSTFFTRCQGDFLMSDIK